MTMGGTGMRCEDIGAFLYLYLDGEFDPSARAEFEVHLRACPACSQRLVAEQRFLEQVRAARRALPAAPAALRGRVRAGLADAEGPSRSRSGLRVPGYVWKPLPLLAALGGLAFLVWPMLGSSLDPVVEELVASHQTESSVDVAGPEAARIQRYYSSRLPFPVRLPHFPGRHTNVLGGRVVRFGDRPSAKVVYEVAGEIVTVMAFEGRGLWQDRQPPPDRGWVLTRSAGYNVALYRVEGVTYGVTSRLGQPQLEQVLRQASFTR